MPLRISSRLFALLFSLFYIALYVIVRGPSFMYFYPPWSLGATVAYIVGGIALQGWFCFVLTRSWPMLVLQVGVGLAYASVVTFFLDRLHMS